MNITDANIIRLLALEMDPVDLITFCLSQKKFYANICSNDEFWYLKLQKNYPNVFNYYRRHNIPFKNPKQIYIRIFKKDAEFVEKSLEYVKKIEDLNPEGIDLMKKFLIYLIGDIRKFLANNKDIRNTENIDPFLSNIIDRTSKERNLQLDDKIKTLVLHIIKGDYQAYEESSVYNIFAYDNDR